MERDALINKIISIVIKVIILAIGISGLIVNFYNGGFMAGNYTLFLYFTIQSNITILIAVLLFLVKDILFLIFKKDYLTHNAFYLIKFLFTVAITITMLVFFGMLAPMVTEAGYLTSYSNLSVHLLVPCLALFDFYYFDKNIKLNKVNPLVGISMPLYYLFFFFICSTRGVDFNGSAEGGFAPYFFLDYQTLGWFNVGENGIGVFYWMIILLVAIIGLCYLMALLMKLRIKYSKDNRAK